MAQQFNVSRTAIREAVSILAAQGFLDVRHGSGTYVNPMSSWNTLDPLFLLLQGEKTTLIELLEVRESLEPTIAYLAAQRATQEDIAELEARLQPGLDVTIEKHMEMDTAFHQTLAQIAKNRVFLILYNSIGDLLRESRRRSFAPDGLARAMYWHRQILEAVKAHDPSRAREAMRQHLDQVRGELKNFIS
jgi:DNA-binding FadR family transcriptional regulator